MKLTFILNHRVSEIDEQEAMNDTHNELDGLSDDERNDAKNDISAVVERLYDRVPFHESLDLEVIVVTPRHAEIKVPFDESLVGNPDFNVIHGGVISALIDVAGGAVFIGTQEDYTPTVDLRVNFLEAAGNYPLYATATIDRHGENIGVASIEVESGDSICATGTGVYKLSGSE